MKKIALAATLFTALSGAFSTAHANDLIVNGSFEMQTQAEYSWNVYPSMTGWTTDSGPGIEVRNHLAGMAYDGANFVELDSNGNSSMSQSIATTLGSLYTLSFAYSPRQGVGSDSNPIEVLWDQQSLGTITADGSANSTNVWQLHSFQVAGSGLDTLTFRAVGISDTVGGGLDAVSLTSAVPEASTSALMIAGLALFGVSRLRRNDR